MKKRFLAGMMACVMLICAVCTPNLVAYAEESDRVIENNEIEENQIYPEITPETTSCQYGYERLGELENGEKLQEAYNRLLDAAWAFYNSDEDAEIYDEYTDQNGFVWTWYSAGLVDLSDLGLSFSECERVNEIFIADNPLFFFLNSIVYEDIEEIKVRLDVATYRDGDTGEYLVDYFSGSKRAEIRQTIERKLHEYYDLRESCTTDYELEKEIYSKIVDEVDYNHEDLIHPEGHNILGAFNETLTVCEGYAKTFQIASNYCGLESIYILGYSNEMLHGWNAIYLDEKWYMLDVTWDDGFVKVDGEKVYYGENSYYGPIEEPEKTFGYMNMPISIFQSSHTLCDETTDTISYQILPEFSDDFTYWDKYIADDELNGSTDEEIIENLKEYIKAELLAGEKSINFLFHLGFQYYEMFNDAFEKANNELRMETGISYAVSPYYEFAAHGINAGDLDKILMDITVPISRVIETEDTGYYLDNIPEKGAYLYKYNLSEYTELPQEIDGHRITVLDLATYCEMKRLILPDQVIVLWDIHYSLRQLVVPETLKEIYRSSRYECNLNGIYLPKSVDYIESQGLGYDNNGIKRDDFTIFGYAGTLAETYAQENGFHFIDVTGKNLVKNVTISEIPDVYVGDAVSECSFEINSDEYILSSVILDTSDEMFQANAKYEAIVTLTAKEGYAFTANTILDVERQPSLFETISDESVQFRVKIQPVERESEYIIKFDANGGIGTIDDTELLSYYEEYTLPEDGFSRDGYVLLGWGTTPNQTDISYELGETISGLTTEDSITLYAIWEELDKNTFSVEHYVMNTDGEYVLGETEIIEGYETDEYILNNFISDKIDDGKILRFSYMTINDSRVEESELIENISNEILSESIIKVYYERVQYIAQIDLKMDEESFMVLESNFYAGSNVDEVLNIEQYINNKQYSIVDIKSVPSNLEVTVEDGSVSFIMPETGVHITIYLEVVEDEEDEVEKSSGLYQIDGVWYYYIDGEVATDYTGLVEHYGSWYYVENGVLNWNYTGLTCYYGTWYYVENGVLNWNYTGLTYYNDAWYYVEGGVLNWNYTGLTCYYGTWYYVENGVLNWNYTGLTYYYGTWYYVEDGILNWGYTGLTYYGGTWYYVEKGILNWNYTGLTYYYGTWYYVEGGVLNWNYTGLVYHYGTWYYVGGGVLDWSYIGTVYYNGTWWYVENGVLVGVA